MARVRKTMNHYSRPVVSALAALTLTTQFRADSEDASARAVLQSSEFLAGQVCTLRLRGTTPGALAVLRYSPSSGLFAFANPLLPVLRIGTPTFPVATGVLDASGRLTVASLVPPTLPPGTTIHLQGFVKGPAGAAWSSSEPLQLEIAPSPALFIDETGSLDPDTALYSSSDVDWADVDRDGRPDVVVANGASGDVTLLLMNQAGSLVSEGMTRFPAEALVSATIVELGDVDDDGDVDLFLGTSNDPLAPAPNRLFKNDGSGVFSLDAAFPAGNGQALDAEFGDLDGDGDLDLVLANQPDPLHPSETPDPVMLLVNQGRLQGGMLGAFVADPLFGSLPGNGAHGDGGDVSLGDVDDDGDLDLFVARTQGATGAQNQLYQNDGLSGFTEITASALPVSLDNSFEADFADFDGDGDLDVFVANSISSVTTGVHLLMNQGPIGPGGSAVFADGSAGVPATFGTNTKVRLSLDIGDVDQDGDPDVAIGVHELPFGPPPATEGRTVLLLNQGGLQSGTPATFAVDAGFVAPLPLVGADVAFGDLDADGDLDLYVANAGRLFVADFQDLLLRND
jgi:hypothetical protein